MNDKTLNTQGTAGATLKAKLAEVAVGNTDKVESLTPNKLSEPKPVLTPAREEKKYHVFYNTIDSCRMTTELGRSISFVKGKYVTDVQEEIDYLQKEMALGSIHIYVEKGKEVMTSDELDPMKALRNYHMKEFIAMQAEVARKIAAGEPLSESESDMQRLIPASTANTVDGAQSSSEA